MLRYEDICQEFIDSAESNFMLVYAVRHVMDVVTCDREFHCVCVDEEGNPPYPIRADVSFPWDAVLTAESNYAEDCPLIKIPAYARIIDRTKPGSFIELEIRICFETVNFEEAGVLAKRIQRLVTNLISPDSQPQIKFEVSILPDGRVVVHDSYIYYCCQVSFNDEGILFSPLCQEIQKILETLVNSSLFG
jgi:hypothetical protein